MAASATAGAICGQPISARAATDASRSHGLVECEIRFMSGGVYILVRPRSPLPPHRILSHIAHHHLFTTPCVVSAMLILPVLWQSLATLATVLLVTIGNGVTVFVEHSYKPLHATIGHGSTWFRQTIGEVYSVSMCVQCIIASACPRSLTHDVAG